MSYPQEPGYRPHAPETSRAAAEVAGKTAPRMIERVEAHLKDHGPAAPEEITAAIAEPDERLLLTSVRARCCQLRALGRVVDSGERGVGESLRTKVIRWRLTTPEERSLWATQRALADEKGEQAHG
jgi:hypothetical protein